MRSELLEPIDLFNCVEVVEGDLCRMWTRLPNGTVRVKFVTLSHDLTGIPDLWPPQEWFDEILHPKTNP